MKLTLKQKHAEAGDAVSFVFRPEAPLRWRAGQFLRYTLGHENPDERGEERYFTIATAPHEERVMLTTRIPERHSTFKQALCDLPVGGEVEADGPEGDFVIEEPGRECIFIAGGIGVTPYRAILRDLDRRGHPIRGKLLYANRDENVVYRDTLDRLAAIHADFSARYFIGGRGIDEAAVRRMAPDLSRPLFYVSGPEPMVEAFEEKLTGMGVPDENLKRDYFPGYDWP